MFLYWVCLHVFSEYLFSNRCMCGGVSPLLCEMWRWLTFVVTCIYNRGVWDAARPAWAGRGGHVGMLVSAAVVPVGPGPEGGDVGRRCTHSWKAGRQTHAPWLPADDHQTGQRDHSRLHLETKDFQLPLTSPSWTNTVINLKFSVTCFLVAGFGLYQLTHSF